MELTWRRGIVLSLAVVAVSTLCQASDTPDYRCFDFLDGLGKRSNDKSVSRQQRKRGGNKCPGPGCVVAIEPRGDIIIEVGSSYDALCLFDPQRIKAKDVYFLHSGKTAEAPYRIPHTVVNNSAISVQVTHDEAVNYKLQCHMNETFLCERSVKVGYMPQDVENFTCVSKNFQTLNCTWKIPENPVRVNYNLTYVVVGFLDTRDCPRTQKQKTECFWDRDHSLFRNEWVMTFTARNKLTKKAVKYNHTVDIYATVIPDPPGELVAEVNGPHDVNLTWKLPYPIDVFPGGVVQEVSYRERLEGYNSEAAPWHVVDQWEVMPKRFESELFSKEINNLRPYTRYDFRVRLHTGTGLIREHMWSDASICTERTVAARPTKAPVTGIGTFEIEETLSLREIYINWRKIDAIFWNGPNFHYRVLVFDNENGRPINKNSQEVEIRETFAKFTNMDKDIPYRFEIRPVNDVGPAAEDVKATVVVLEMASILKPLSFFRVTAINEDNSTIYMSRWHLPDVQQENQMIETLTIYWCKKDKYEQRCQNKLEWITIEDMNITSKNLTDLDDSSLYMFGISANSNNSSSGIKWLTCIASHGNRPPPLEKFGVTHKTNTEVKLNWALDCKAKAAVPTGFNISYCSVADSVDDCPPEAEIMYETLHDETLVEYVVEKLHPYTNYIFNIAILTEIGLGKWSSSVKAKTMPYKPSGPPQDLEVRTKGQEWVLLAWKPPLAEELNGKIFEYIVTSEPPVDRFNVRANSTSNVTMLNVTNLEPYTEYIFQVIPCTEGPRVAYCGDISASFEVRTKIGAPGEIDSIDQEDDQLEWEHEECNAPQCSFEIHYRMNGTDHAYFTSAGHLAVNFKDLNITCTESQEEINIDMRAISKDEDGQTLKGPWKDKKIICHIPAMAWWIILIIAAVCIIVTLILVGVGTYGWDQIKEFLYDLHRKPIYPPGLDPDEYKDFHPPLPPPTEGKKPWFAIPREKKHSTSSTTISDTSEVRDLIKPGSGKERQGRNLSGDSGTSEGDPGDSSGCSVGGESDSSSGSDRVPPSSDSGTVQEEPGFPSDKKWSGSVRLRTPGPPYVRRGLLPEKVSGMGGYVSVGSVPNLAGGMAEGVLSLQQSTPSLALGTLPEMPLGARRTSTGYISMPDADAVNLHLDVLGNFTLRHEGRGHNGFPVYSRHNFPQKKPSTPELSPYSKAESLPWLNTGYVTVAQAEGGIRPLPGARGYVAVGDAVSAMKRQPSLPSLAFGPSKSVTTPDEDLPPGAYCRVGARGSPGPPPGSSPGYVSITQDLTSQTTPTISSSSPVIKSPYVTCAVAESIASPKKEPEKVTGDYVSVGDIANGRWANPVIPPSTIEESREVASAPIEGSRGRPSLPTRPNTSETNHNRGGNRWPPLGPSLSKQSSGYVSGNVSQETLAFHDPVVMSPKKLLARSHEPHSVVYSPNHKPSMV